MMRRRERVFGSLPPVSFHAGRMPTTEEQGHGQTTRSAATAAFRESAVPALQIANPVPIRRFG